MPNIGVRELKNQATEIVRAVREQRTEYIVTHHGRPVAILLPLASNWEQIAAQHVASVATPSDDLWLELAKLREEIDTKWESEKSAVELVTAQRR